MTADTDASTSVSILAPIISGIITILGSGLVVGIVTHFMQVATEERAFRREKLESLFELLSSFLLKVTDDIKLLMAYHHGGAYLGSVHDIIYEHMSEQAKMRHQFCITSSIYFPAISAEVEKFGELARNILNDSYPLPKGGMAPTPERVKVLNEQHIVLQQKFSECRSLISREGLLVNNPIAHRCALLFDALWR